ncbi:MAG TPA: prepilin-type N-terminal cleavage/methylation domain-containing protein [Candidatus Saccharimonadales bacterium]|nr:prepilin-type N-terminal cleavage/methylation domain-containing protein [Candidatus Saccharimonadales bacterium]
MPIRFVNRRSLMVNRLKNDERYTMNYKPAFTLIELLIVISIIAILVASATASWRNAQIKSRDGKRKADLKSVQQALETYLQTNGKYPASSAGQIQCNVTGDATTKTWGNVFTCGAINYMQQLPTDPSYQAASGYYYNSTTTTSYTISSLLENTNDADLYSKTGTPCANPIPAPPARNYCATNP